MEIMVWLKLLMYLFHFYLQEILLEKNELNAFDDYLPVGFQYRITVGLVYNTIFYTAKKAAFLGSFFVCVM